MIDLKNEQNIFLSYIYNVSPLLPDVSASGYLRFTICSLRKWNKELDRSHTVKVGSQINMVNRTLLKLEQYRKWEDRTL